MRLDRKMGDRKMRREGEVWCVRLGRRDEAGKRFGVKNEMLNPGGAEICDG
jgi:hypothetical protein